MKSLHFVAFLLLIVGGLNWLLIGVFSLDVVQWLLGGLGDIVPRIVYVLVGLAAVYELLTHKRTCRECSASPSSSTM